MTSDAGLLSRGCGTRTLVLAGSVALTVLGAACGNDDETAATAIAPTTETAATQTTGANEDEKVSTGVESDPDHPYCEVERQIYSLIDEAFQSVDPTSTDEDQLVAALQEAAQRIIDRGLLQQGEALVPEEIRADFELLVADVRDVANENFAFQASAASEAAGARRYEFCGLSDED